MDEFLKLLLQIPELMKTPMGLLILVGLIGFGAYRIFDVKSNKDFKNIIDVNNAMKTLGDMKDSSFQSMQEREKELMDKVDSLYDRANGLSEEIMKLRQEMSQERSTNLENLARLRSDAMHKDSTIDMLSDKLRRIAWICLATSYSLDEKMKRIINELQIENGSHSDESTIRLSFLPSDSN